MHENNKTINLKKMHSVWSITRSRPHRFVNYLVFLVLLQPHCFRTRYASCDIIILVLIAKRSYRNNYVQRIHGGNIIILFGTIVLGRVLWFLRKCYKKNVKKKWSWIRESISSVTSNKQQPWRYSWFVCTFHYSGAGSVYYMIIITTSDNLTKCVIYCVPWCRDGIRRTSHEYNEVNEYQ